MDTLLLPHFTTKRTIAIHTIEYMEALGNYTRVHLKGQKPMLVAVTLKRFEERLPQFLRIHKGLLVNPAHIINYRIQSVSSPFVELSKDRQLTISRRKTRCLGPTLASYKSSLS